MTSTRARSRSASVGVTALIVALVGLLVLTFLPSPYVIQRPGPVFNTLGDAKTEDGTETPLISIGGAETYPTAGALDLTTVQVVGNREHTPSWMELILAWLDPARAVVPIDAVFPQGVTTDQRNQQNQTLMVNSQHDATAAALRELGYDVPVSIEIDSVIDGGAAQGVLQKDDRIVAIDGEAVTDAPAMRARVQQGAGASLTLTIERGGARQDVSVTPKAQESDGKKTWLVGVTLRDSYAFPVDVTLRLDDVGGPSAGMMFALGIVDVLTPGELNGGKQIAGTGTITADGAVGPIGGIRQKLYGARDAGATYFLAPGSNCDEVVGHVPDGLRVIRTDKLADSVTALKTIADGGDVDALPTCTTAPTP
ncbi:PDZ domain-containing protein [Microbacterium resistens]|uniref:endopeptidase La n=1 Tax=Microbacterium resistens TaxID=156977 RepID=A0ABU1S7C3_9MICO|nr:S16 family serine protease [Microbacterium resistens]MDR6865517.1 PDZ domain-containing protein [Microbacterium resistens]